MYVPDTGVYVCMYLYLFHAYPLFFQLRKENGNLGMKNNLGLGNIAPAIDLLVSSVR